MLLDLSCGSGLFTRRFVGSSQFEGVIAADYSETMLQQTRQLFNEQPSLDKRYVFLICTQFRRGVLIYPFSAVTRYTGCMHSSQGARCTCGLAARVSENNLSLSAVCACRKLGLVRADVARLPFATGSLSAIHAGAAIHCWPDPTAAVSIVYACG